MDPRRDVRKVIGSLRERGVRRTLLRIAQEVALALEPRWFDLRHGTETARLVPLPAMNIHSRNLSHATGLLRRGVWHYQGVAAMHFRAVVEALELPRGGVFVDVGAGKGKALLLAAEAGFRNLVGVEFSPELCDVARRNLAVYARRRGVELNARIVQADAADYEVDDEANVFFVYNPFDEVVLTTVVENVRRSVERKPRKIWLLYVNPVHREALERHPLLRTLRTFELPGQTVVAYQNEDEDRAGAEQRP